MENESAAGSELTDASIAIAIKLFRRVRLSHGRGIALGRDIEAENLPNRMEQSWIREDQFPCLAVHLDAPELDCADPTWIGSAPPRSAMCATVSIIAR